MDLRETKREHRRLLTKFLAMSPLFAIPSLPFREAGAMLQDPLITEAGQALNVFDFRRVAQAKLSPAHFGYLETGVLDDWTLRENEAAFRRVRLRMRRLIDGSAADTTATLWGETWASPIVLAPCGSQQAFHAEGELATAKAAGTQNALQILSTMSTTAIEEVVDAKGSPVWFQLYPAEEWEGTLHMLDRAKATASPAIVLTVDSNYPDRRETAIRARRLDTSNCQSCHGRRTAANYVRNKPMVRDLPQPYQVHKRLDWDYVGRLREATEAKLWLKGIVSVEDARKALDYGIDGLVVSNHGGRVSESGKASLDSLAEIAQALQGQVPLMMDGGVRRGKDVFKALALGADLVAIGRPYLWGLSAFGQVGVEVVVKLLTAELKLAMQQAGVSSVAEIGAEHIER